METIARPALLANVEEISRFLRQEGTKLKIDADRVADADLAIEELCVNIINYAYPKEKPGEIEVRSWSEGKNWFLELRDTGRPFDITKLQDPELEQPVHKRERIKIGGLGIFLSKRLVTRLQYRRENGQNITTITV